MTRRKISHMNVSTPDRDYDYFPVLDMSEPADTVARNKGCTPSRLDATDSNFYTLPTVTTSENGDSIVIYSELDGGYRRITRQNFFNPVAGAGTIAWIINGNTTGATVFSSNIDRFTFGTEVFANVTNQVTNTALHGTVSDHTTNAYTFGGRTTGNYVDSQSRCEKTVMATGVTSVDAAFALTAGYAQMISCKTTSAKGYLAGGYNTATVLQTITHKTVYATSTASLQASAYLTVAYAGMVGVGDGSSKIIFTRNSNTELGKITAATDTYTTLNNPPLNPFNLTIKQLYTGYLGNGIYGYSGHGGSNANSGGILKILIAIESTAFLNDGQTVSFNNVRWPNYGVAAYSFPYSFSDGSANGWSMGGGTTNIVYKLVFSTDTTSTSASVMLSNSFWGGCCNTTAV